MTLDELKTKVDFEIKRAESYRPRTDLGPFSSLSASPDYMRGGLDALKDVAAMLEEVK